METKNKIEMISLALIDPHPNNPRKDLGDLSELAESIKAQGVLQNLTVVPQEGGRYRCVIGHRRCAASKLAGLTEVPCTITDMDDKEQASVMLLENMQRTDLTVMEQAKGIQLVMDLGISKTEISKKTGFSRSTIDSRLNLLKYDERKAAAALKRGATLLDFIEINKVKSEKEREQLVDALGTNNFKNYLKAALDKEKKAEKLKAVEAAVATFATAAKNREEVAGYKYVRWFTSGINPDEITVPDDEPPADTTEYKYLKDSNYFGIYLYRRPTAEEIKESQEENRARADRERRFSQLDEASKRAYELRKDFVKSVSPSKAAKHADAIMCLACYAMKDLSENHQYQTLNLPPGIDKPAQTLLRIAYNAMDSRYLNDYDYLGKYHPNPKLDEIYDFLDELGYEVSDEEKQLRDGTHELYVRED